MTSIKRFMIIAMISSAQLSYTSYNAQDDAFILTAKEITLIKTNRILSSLEQVLKTIDESNNWTIFNDATVPSRTEQIELATPLFAELIQNIIANYGTCFEVTVPTFFGLSDTQELRIINAANSELTIITNQNFLKLLKKAMKYFEVENKEHEYYTTEMNIQITLSNGAIQTTDLHKIYEAIEKAAA